MKATIRERPCVRADQAEKSGGEDDAAAQQGAGGAAQLAHQHRFGAAFVVAAEPLVMIAGDDEALVGAAGEARAEPGASPVSVVSSTSRVPMPTRRCITLIVAVPAGTVIEAVACVHDAAMAGVPICWYVATPAAVRNSANIVVATPARYQVLNAYVCPGTTPTGLNRHPA